MKRILFLNALFFASLLLGDLAHGAPQTLESCHKAHDADHSGDDGNQPAMNMVEGNLEKCVTGVMNAALDHRLLSLKKPDPAQYQSEMKLQANFNQGSKDFEDAFYKNCDGSACGLCSPKKGLNELRAAQALLVNGNNLAIPATKAEKIEMKSSIHKKIEKVVKKYFDAFIGQYCRLPNEIWKDKSIPKDCASMELNELVNELYYFFSIPGGDDGDVCQQFPLK